MPLANPHTRAAIMQISGALLGKKEGEVLLLNVVHTPEQTDFYHALAASENVLDLLETAAKSIALPNVRITPIVRASHQLAKGIVHAGEEENCDLIIMGYSGRGSKKNHLHSWKTC